MTPQTYSLQMDAAAFERYTTYERERREADSESHGERPEGMRLSTDCPVRRVRSVFDARFRTPMASGIAERGHEMSSRFRAVILGDREHAAEIPIAWEGDNESAWDAIIAGIPIEHKSASGSQRPKPENIAQVKRMAVAYDLAHDVTPEIWVSDPGALTTTGPHPVEINDEDRERITKELAACSGARNYLQILLDQDPTDDLLPYVDEREWWAQHGLYCKCGGCITRTAFDAHPHVSRLIETYTSLKNKADDWDNRASKIRAAIIDAAELQAPAEGPAGLDINMPGVKVFRNVKGSWTVKVPKETK